MNAKIIVFANQKGGVGKTTSAVNIGACMAQAGKKVLLIDFDPQGNLSSAVGANSEADGVYELIAGTCQLNDVIQKTKVENLFVIASRDDLSAAGIELVNQDNREFFLKEALEPYRGDWDYILLDCPPSVGLLTLNGLVASDCIVVPLQCEYFALEGLSMLLRTMKGVQQAFNPKLDLAGIIFTMYDARTRLSQDVVREASTYFQDKIFNTLIPRNVRLSEAPSYGLPIALYDPNCAGAKAYKELTEEVMNRVS